MANRQCKPIPQLSDLRMEIFWGFVSKSTEAECWEWNGGRMPKGYGHFSLAGKTFKAHRIAYLLDSGSDPGQFIVCHHCDNPPCCNPSHLFLGTHKDNAADRSAKGRGAFGDRNWTRKYPERLKKGGEHILRKHPELAARGEMVTNSKITAAIAIGIRARHATGLYTGKQVATFFGLSKSLVYDVLNRKTWKHV